MRPLCWCAIVLLSMATRSWGQPADAWLTGRVVDETGGVLPGVVVVIESTTGRTATRTITDGAGSYAVEQALPGTVDVSFTLPNFAPHTDLGIELHAGGNRLDVTLHLALNAEVTVTDKRTFTSLADVSNPSEDLLGIAQSASQGAITARQLETRPLARVGEVLETVPGVIISQHSGEGKANQYYLRGFNLDHGTDFATTVAGIPVNMPTHAHGQGYSDLNFLIPELVSGVQFAKGPYFAEQGDFATAGSATINYVGRLNEPIVRLTAGGEGYSRAMAAISPRLGAGHLLVAGEVNHNDGPWDRSDNFRKVNGIVRFTTGDPVNNLSLTVMGYDGSWNATDQIPSRGVSQGVIGRFGTIDPTDGGRSSRVSLSGEWQRGAGASLTKVAAYGVASDLKLFSNFTYFLDDPVLGDQFEQADRRIVSGGRISHLRFDRWRGRLVKTTVGAQLRNDFIADLGLYHTHARQRLETRSQASALETSVAGYVQTEVAWTGWLRTLTGLRADQFRFHVDALDKENSGTEWSGLAAPKLGIALGPWKGTELYANAGSGYHSNDARGTTITRDVEGHAVNRVTPLVRATASEIGLRTLALPHLQSTIALWQLDLASELVFVGDAGTTEGGRPSHRHGLEWTNYFTPTPWLTVDADLSWSGARFVDFEPAGDRIPGAVGTVGSLGLSVSDVRRAFAGVRWRYFGPRPLVEDGGVQSRATSLFSLEAGYKAGKSTRIAVDVFNLLNSTDSDIDYYYRSRLPGEPIGGVDDVHFHPTLPRTARLTVTVGF